jgi:hypothetical protein
MSTVGTACMRRTQGARLYAWAAELRTLGCADNFRRLIHKTALGWVRSQPRPSALEADMATSG